MQQSRRLIAWYKVFTTTNEGLIVVLIETVVCQYNFENEAIITFRTYYI